MKRLPALTLLLVLTLALCLPVRAVTTSATSAILMDAESGRVLYTQNVHERRLIASITKLMTALVAVEESENLDQKVEILPEWLGSEGSSIYLRAGERISLRALLYGLLLQSGNDAAMALACATAGDAATFVGWMNDRAKSLGMEDTSFANPSGLNDENHYSTAYDMALLAQACLENETVAEVCATKSVTIGERTFYNHNKLLFRYEGCVGMKTGFTERAGRTLISAATRDGQTLICVTLNDGDDWRDHTNLLDYGFSVWPRKVLCQTGEEFGGVAVSGSLLTRVPAVAAEEVGCPLQEGETLSLSVTLDGPLTAPFPAGTPVGEAVWSRDGEPVAQVTLVTAHGAGLDAWAPLTLWERFRALLDARKSAAPIFDLLTDTLSR